ncbi:MAG: FHA domain-containing protein [Akkermansia sp.]|nr:FHA domain-containing protein [Akkermansia sp.]
MSHYDNNPTQLIIPVASVDSPSQLPESVPTQVIGHTAAAGGETIKIDGPTEPIPPHPAPTPKPSPEISPDDYPMGFLVVIGGPMRGSFFVVRANQNSLGRALNNHICMKDDPRVSREKHCFIIYSVDDKKFFIRPGDGSGIVFINDSLLFTPTELKHGDIIRLSNNTVPDPTVLRLYSVIDDRFQWEVCTR